MFLFFKTGPNRMVGNITAPNRTVGFTIYLKTAPNRTGKISNLLRLHRTGP